MSVFSAMGLNSFLAARELLLQFCTLLWLLSFSCGGFGFCSVLPADSCPKPFSSELYLSCENSADGFVL